MQALRHPSTLLLVIYICVVTPLYRSCPVTAVHAARWARCMIFPAAVGTAGAAGALASKLGYVYPVVRCSLPTGCRRDLS
jgi:hypothetical protein